MEQDNKYLPQTAAALLALEETAALLANAAADTSANHSALKQELTNIKKEIAAETSRIDDIIQTLNGAIS